MDRTAVLRAIRRYLHVAGTAWFVVCLVFMLLVSLHRANVQWVVLFPLAGPGLLALLLLISVYLFALFRGMSGSNKLADEHPVTSTRLYKGFYATVPFWGSVVGFAASTEPMGSEGFFVMIALGGLFMTFVVWVLVDPVLGSLETIVPASARQAMLRRRARERHDARLREEKRQALLTEVLAAEERQAEVLRRGLEPRVDALCALLARQADAPAEFDRQVVGLGLEAWRMGGKEGMETLWRLAQEHCGGGTACGRGLALVESLWEGVGSWRAGRG